MALGVCSSSIMQSSFRWSRRRRSSKRLSLEVMTRKSKEKLRSDALGAYLQMNVHVAIIDFRSAANFASAIT
jgi:hypothetical protein